MRKRIIKTTYPRLCFRIEPALLQQVNALRSASGLSYGQIITRSLRKTLPLLQRQEAELKTA